MKEFESASRFDAFKNIETPNLWGRLSSTGDGVKLMANGQTLKGNITCDSISSINVVLKNCSTFTGTVNGSNKAKYVSLTIDSESEWHVTGTSYITRFSNGDASLCNIIDNGNTIYYDSSDPANRWLEGKTILLFSGGKLTPVNE